MRNATPIRLTGAVLLTLAVWTSVSARNPAVLVHCPRATPDLWSWWVDLDYLRELHERGFEVDYTDRHGDLTAERLKDYDVLVLFTVPLEDGAYYDNTPDLPPYLTEFGELVEGFLERGGGVLLMARAINADETFLPLIGKWGARIPYERIVETAPDRLAAFPNMRGFERAWFTDAVSDSPVSSGVSQVWLPLVDSYAAAHTAPIAVSEDWQVVLRGGPSSRTTPVAANATTLQPPPTPLVRPGGVRAPDLFAVRSYKHGRIAFCAIWPQYSIGQGTRWLYQRAVLSRGLGGRPSHFGRLLENSLRWLGQPRLDAHPGPAFRTDPVKLVPPNQRPGVAEAFNRRFVDRPFDSSTLLRRARQSKIYRGLIGAQSRLGSGHGSVAEHAHAAREHDLDFVVFLEDFGQLDEDEFAELKAECEQRSDERLQLWPGYRIETNVGNSMFVFGRGASLPPATLIDGGRLNLQYRDPLTGAYATSSPFIDWINYRLLARNDANVGYYGFRDRPHAQPLYDLRLYSLAAVQLHREGQLLETVLADYLAAAATTLPPAPVAVHLISSPAQLQRAARESKGLTFLGARSVDSLWDALAYSGPYRAPNVFVSDGPRIEAWPDAFLYYTFGAEESVPAAARMPSPLVVRSDKGLREIRVFDGERLHRRFRLDGAKSFELVLELSAAIQHTLVVVAEDVDGKLAISNARRSWKGGDQSPMFCGDRINDCRSDSLMAKGPGTVLVARVPEILAGYSWDGGPRGVLPVLDLVRANRPSLRSNRGTEGERGFLNQPVLSFADEGAARAISRLEQRYEPAVPVLNPWVTFGPVRGATALLSGRAVTTVLDRPTVGARPDGPEGFAERTGAQITLFEQRIRFLQKQRIEQLELFTQKAYGGPFPVFLLHGRKHAEPELHELTPGRRQLDRLGVATGDWLAFWGPEPTNTTVLVNRGEPLLLDFSGGQRLTTRFLAGLAGRKVRADDLHAWELMTVIDPVDEQRRGPPRVRAIVDRLRAPSDIELLRGSRNLGERPGRAAWGIVELWPDAGAVALRARRPERPVNVPVPLRIHELNRRWSAGVLQKRGHSLGVYRDGTNRWRPLGIDEEGRAWLPLFTDAAAVTELVAGHPVTADHEELFIQVTRTGDGPSDWHVSVNNPTDDEIEATVRPAMDLPDFPVRAATLRIPSGGYVVLFPPASRSPGGL